MAENMLRRHPENGNCDEHDPMQGSEASNSGVYEEASVEVESRFEERVLLEVLALKAEISSRDILLQKLEESVTRLAEDFGPLKEFVMAKMREEQEVEGLQQSALLEGAPQVVAANTEDIARTLCIEAMMRMTDIMENNDIKTSRVREIYEKIYNTAPLTSFILRYLQSHPEVKILIDCDSSGIHRLVKRIHNRDAEKIDGSKVQAFADFLKHMVYMGNVPAKYNRVVNGCSCARAGHPTAAFIMSLAQTAIHLIFKNGGSPYSCNDDTNENLYDKIIQEAVKVRSEGRPCDDLLYFALNSKSTLGKEIELIAVVPGMLVKYGLNVGMKTLTDQLPWLLLFYMQSVLPKMMN